MKMRKPSSVATVLSRTCPLCFTMVDPVWYGWHISMCTSKSSQDTAPSTTLVNNEAHDSQIVVATCKELPEARTISISPASQLVEENSKEKYPKRIVEIEEHELILLRIENQALADKVKDLELQLEKFECERSAEKQALADKVNCLELNVEELQCRLRLSKESERKALLLVESLQGSSGKEDRYINEAGQCSHLPETTTIEPETLSSVKQSMEFGKDGIVSGDKQGKEAGDQSEDLDSLKEKIVETVLTKSVEIELDCVVSLACIGRPISKDFLSQVDDIILLQKVAKANEGSIEETNSCAPRLDTEIHHALDKDKSIKEIPEVFREGKSNAKETHSGSSSSSSKLEVHSVKGKAGLRRIVLSDSESEDGDMKANCNHCNRGSNAEGPKFLASNLEGAGAVEFEDGEPVGARRSKRLRTLSLLESQSKDPVIPSNGRVQRRKVVVSYSEESGSLQGSKEFNSDVVADAHSNPDNITLGETELPSTRKKFRQMVEVSSSSSAETSGHNEELSSKRSKRPPMVRKRLFEEVESKPAYGDKHSTDSEDDGSENESDADSLKDFIADSEGSEDSGSSNDEQTLSASHSSRDAYCNPRLERDIKIRHYVWELEPEMLSAFAVNPELCLRAVCAINRRQTEDERIEKMSKYTNKRGFDKLHAKRGTRIAGFLTNGDPEGPVKKSIEDLKKFDAGGLEFCKMIAAMHSKQLFEIYNNTEDPHFPFS